ncbi:Hypothetical predicted protein [Mytilus galloprovincialis]|uniref:Fucolectin tachylectin-4 pentraxin-1 domain-containing protein n=1 Tax=Mytilus galloprovincialis TaxID=29158 RepID=A0A8B6F0M1_MYTGA|nr:Hypothetical predicted protein [Mytilus galloprovincialis]
MEVSFPMWSVCAQLCSRMQICKSINFIALNKTCQINYAEPDGTMDGLIKSVGNSFIAASTFPKELAGSCKGHDCKVNEVCIPQSPNCICVPLLEAFAGRGTREGSLVSQYKTTGQSTSYTCQADEQCGSEAGVDGIKGPKNMFHTHSELEPFWWVNLGEVYEIQKVISTNRINCCGEQLRKMLVHVGESLDTCGMKLCGQFVGPGVTGQVIVTPCSTFPKGQIVKLTSVNDRGRVFHLSEVEVYGVK